MPGEGVAPVTGSLPPGYVVVDTIVSNTDPNLASSDFQNDGEPSIAVDPTNTNRIDITAFSSTWSAGNAAIFHSSNSGTTWTKELTIPQPTGVAAGPGCPCDQTLASDRSGNVFASILNEIPPGDVYTGDTTDSTNASAWQWNVISGVAQTTESPSSLDADQPWLAINRDPTTSSQDDAYVAYGDFTNPFNIRVESGVASRPPTFSNNSIMEAQGCCVNPGARLATDTSTGTIYAIWQRGLGHTGTTVQVEYDINRSTNGGATWLLSGHSFGQVVATADSTQGTISNASKFGTVNALIGGVDSAAVDSSSGAVYYVYGARDSATQNNRLVIVRLTDNGAGGMTIGTPVFITGQVQAALPSVSVASNGTVGVLYDTFDGFDVSGFPTFSAHLAQSTDQGTTFSDTTLLTFLSPATDNGNARQRVLGDYQQLKSVGTTFFGTFTGNGAAFGRSTSNNDPIFFRAPAASASGSPPTITSFTPPSGPVGTPVTITGTNFTGATAVKFNGTSVTSFAIDSDTQISTTVPPGASTGTISVTGPGGTGTSLSSFSVTGAAGAFVSVADFAFSPKTLTVQQGTLVEWDFNGPSPHSATDSLLLRPGPAPLFDSGSQGAGGKFQFEFDAAGTDSYKSSLAEPTKMTGTVKVRMKASPTSGTPSTTFTITWSSQALSGYGFAVQKRFKPAGSTTWGPWVNFGTLQTAPSGSFVPDQGSGTYQFRSSLKNISSSKASKPSAPISVKVT